MINIRGQLTQYTEGSVRELWTISYPLILGVLSGNGLLFLDRILLAKYNMQAMNAAVVAWLVFGVFQYGTMGVAAISEIFVGQYNGADKIQKIGAPVWQMIWFSLITSLLFIPIGIFAESFFIPYSDYMIDGAAFFRILMLFGPIFPLVAALSSFFVGQGQVKLVMITTILSNTLNILLDYLLIFGINDLLPALGASGAAIATGIAQTFQAIMLFVIFLKRKHRNLHGTNQWYFNPKLFWHMLKIGFPRSLSDILSAIAWGVLPQILVLASEAHITVYSIGDSFYVLLGFGFWGLQKGITTVAANYIGANREEILTQSLRSGIKIVLVMMLILAIPVFLLPDRLAEIFLNQKNSTLFSEEIRHYLATSIRWLWLYFLFDGVAWLFHGVLVAAGDTKFIMLLSSISPWVFSILPTYITIIYLKADPTATWILSVIYGGLNAACLLLRYKKKQWIAEQPLLV